ncbi:MAG: phage baseplate protein [Rhizobiales bacterium]|nr:phage baseplate protein [Hyphomicrobiales bacterium]
MLDRRDIPYLHWQPRLGRAAGDASAIGAVVHGLDDVEQSIRAIVLTEKGSVPGQPEKCCRLAPYIDRRPDVAIPNITREIFDAVTAWEPRVVVERVAVTRVDFARWSFPVFWRLRSDVAREIRRTIVRLPGERIPKAVSDAA